MFQFILLSGDKLERDNLFYLLFTFYGFVNKQLLLLTSDRSGFILFTGIWLA